MPWEIHPQNLFGMLDLGQKEYKKKQTKKKKPMYVPVYGLS